MRIAVIGSWSTSDQREWSLRDQEKWFWGRLGLRRVLILTRGKVEVPSDFAGVESA